MQRFRCKLTPLFAILLMMVVICLVSGCSRKQTSPTGGTGVSILTIKGSDTMVHLVSAWTEAFMKAHPDIQVSVTGGGSGTGIAALMNGTTDIAAASRNLSAAEKAQASQKKLSLTEIPVGLDGLAIVTHPENPIKVLTMAQLKDLYTGKITNWEAVGGPSLPVLLYSRESSSGTYAFFQEHVLKKADYAKSARLMPASSGIIEAVAVDKGGIGYVGLGYVQKAASRIHVLGIKPDAGTGAVLPSGGTVKNKTYPIARALLLITPGKTSENSRKFMTYAISEEGQSVVQQSGYIPVQPQ